MKTLYFTMSPRTEKNRIKLEKELNVKIGIKGEDVIIDGEPVDEYLAEKIIDALGFGFQFKVAILIKKEDFLFEVLNIKDYTKKKDFKRIKARIIGTRGKTLKTLSHLTECYLEIKDNSIGIIGAPEYIHNCQNAVISLIRGSKQANVYAFLEKHRVKPVFDFALKPVKKKRSKKK